MYCTNCGHKIDQADMYCTECGAKNVEFEIPDILKRDQTGFVPDGGTDEAAAGRETKEKTGQKIPGGKMIILLVVLGIILVIIFYTAVSFMTGVSRKGEPEVQKAAEEVVPEIKDKEPEEEVKEEKNEEPVQDQDEKEHTYEIIEQDVTWLEAKEICEEKGGYLASITSQEEYNIILKKLGETNLKVVWLGGVDEEENGDFQWIRGEKFDFSDWAPGEPNNAQGIEHYLVMYKVKGSWCWNDAPVNANTYYKSHMVGFVCEYEE